MEPLPYRNFHTTPVRQPRLLWPSITLLLLTLAEWGLFELLRMPYRPPHDMGTMLGGSEIAFVRLMMILLLVPWMISVIWMLRATKRR